MSDLHCLSLGQRQYLAQTLSGLTPREEDIREWNDALEYLTGTLPEQTARAAQRRLIDLLSKSDKEL